MGGLRGRRSGWGWGYFFIGGVLMEGEVEVEDGFFDVLGQVYFLPDYSDCYLYSLTMTVSPFLTEMISVSPFPDSFFESGRLRMATRIFGCSIFKYTN